MNIRLKMNDVSKNKDMTDCKVMSNLYMDILHRHTCDVNDWSSRVVPTFQLSAELFDVQLRAQEQLPNHLQSVLWAKSQ